MTEPAVPPTPGVRIGRVLGVPVLVAPSWLLFAALVVVSSGPTLAERLTPATGYLAATAFAVLLLLSVLVHEVGHAVVARAFDLPVHSITVSLLGGRTEITELPQTPAREYSIAVVGPLLSLLLAGLGVAGVGLSAQGSVAALLCGYLAVANGSIAALNLLPGLPLDGGRVLRAALWGLTGRADSSTVQAAWAGRVVGLVVIPLLLVALPPALGLGGVSIALVLLAGLVSSFVYLGATAALQRVRLTQRLPRASVELLARPALGVPADLPLSEAVRRAQDVGARGVVVLDARGTPVAVVSEAAVLAVPEHRRPWVDVSSVARRLVDGMVLDPRLTGEPLLAAMRCAPATEYVVHDADSGVVLVLAASDVAAAVTA